MKLTILVTKKSVDIYYMYSLTILINLNMLLLPQSEKAFLEFVCKHEKLKNAMGYRSIKFIVYPLEKNIVNLCKTFPIQLYNALNHRCIFRTSHHEGAKNKKNTKSSNFCGMIR